MFTQTHLFDYNCGQKGCGYNMREAYLKKAEDNLPDMIDKIIVSQNSDAVLKNDDETVIDLGLYCVGYFSFNLNYVDNYIDAPVRIYIKFCETKEEIDDDFSLYTGNLCKSWLQEEIINVDFPGVYNMPRRYAARYIKIKIIATRQKVHLSDFKFRTVTSADIKQLKEFHSSDKELEKIDAVAVNTLKNCMQRVFEDGPKRDRRLWIGDLHLEAIANYYTFNNLSLVKRCLYLFAAAEINDAGFLPGYIFENPKYVSGNWFLEDYALLFVATACDYYNFTGEQETFIELYPVIKQQMESANKILDNDGIITVANGCEAFIDWCEGLEKITALHGIYLYVLNMLADVLSKMNHSDAKVYLDRYNEAKYNAQKVLFNKPKKMFINEKDNNQHSVHSAVWMILGGVIDGDEAVDILFDSLKSPMSIKPFTPYMHHYVVDAMIRLGLYDKAKEYIKKYWGAMVNRGADTFYEAFVPDNPDFSPYKDKKINSMCHAWSCTPTYFIRKYLNNEDNY